METPSSSAALSGAVTRIRLCTAVTAALCVALFHVLTLHLVWSMRSPLALLCALLAVGWLLAWFTARQALSIPQAHRTPVIRAWALVDHEALALLAFFALLAIGFFFEFTRAGGDGRDYFLQLRSAVMDFDLDFRNDIATFGGQEPQTFPVGSAILWMPFFVAGHCWFALLGLFGATVRLDGYWNPYQMAVGIGSLVYGCAGIAMTDRIARRYYAAPVALLSAIGVAAGSFLLYYMTVEGSYSHANSFFAVTLFTYLWLRVRNAGTTPDRDDRTVSPCVRDWVMLGVAGGLMLLVRWQNAIFFVLPFLDTAPAYLARGWTRLARAHVACGAATAIVFVPQLAFWKVVNGGWLAVPQGQAGQQWWRDSLFVDVLFSSNHGLLAWHPLLYVGLLGVPFLFRREPRLTALLLAAFIAQAYVNGANSTWFGGSAFGGRRFDGTLVLFVLGLASLTTAMLRRPMVMAASLAGVGVLFNALLVLALTEGRIPAGEGVTYAQMFDLLYERVGNPFSFPASLRFAHRYDTSPAQYDRTGRNWYNNIHIDVGTDDASFLGGGWSDAEHEGDRSYRWAVGPRSFVVAPLRSELRVAPGQPMRMEGYRIRFRAEPFSMPGRPPQTITVVVNDALVATVQMQDEWDNYEVAIPRRLLRRNINGIEFRYGYTVTPATAGLSDDPRALAARFDQIDLLRGKE